MWLATPARELCGSNVKKRLKCQTERRLFGIINIILLTPRRISSDLFYLHVSKASLLLFASEGLSSRFAISFFLHLLLLCCRLMLLLLMMMFVVCFFSSDLLLPLVPSSLPPLPQPPPPSGHAQVTNTDLHFFQRFFATFRNQPLFLHSKRRIKVLLTFLIFVFLF